MATSTSKTPCATCGDKGVGIFKCEGCTQVFCRKHVIEHRDVLSQQLDEIVSEYDSLQQTMIERRTNKNQQYPLIKQIDQWERDSIEKIRKTANEVRQQVRELGDTSEDTVSMALSDLAKRLQKARQDDDYVENDLRVWTTKLEKLKNDINTVSPSINVYEDPTNVLVGKMYVGTIQNSLAFIEERFDDFIGNVAIQDNGRVALQCGPNRCTTFVRGKSEYSKGTHKIRFIINKKDSIYVMSFNIVSTSVPKLAILSQQKYSSYGWQTDDCENNPDGSQNKGKLKDLQGETTLQLELTIDCDHRKISYFNERTKNIREMSIDIKKCPLPWRLEFYLYDVGDCVKLIS